MKIIVWNCNMSLARKRELLLALEPDVLILQEVSRKDVDETSADFKAWVGSNPNKGLAVLAFGEHDYRALDDTSDDLPWLVPLEIADLGINVLGVWAHVKDNRLRYVRVLHAALPRYQGFITGAPTIMAGDFNSNAIWDKHYAEDAHTPLVAKLDALGLSSLYHETTGEAHGEERTPTWYMYRHRDKAYHLDYAFVPSALVAGSTIRVGHPDEWLPHSDHMPLIVELGAI